MPLLKKYPSYEVERHDYQAQPQNCSYDDDLKFQNPNFAAVILPCPRRQIFATKVSYVYASGHGLAYSPSRCCIMCDYAAQVNWRLHISPTSQQAIAIFHRVLPGSRKQKAVANCIEGLGDSDVHSIAQQVNSIDPIRLQ